MLYDKFNRIHDYLRISLTDNCNFRCSYCMPEEKISCLPNHQLMKPEEIVGIARIFVDLGIQKIRLTGGEPLLRKDFGEIFSKLSCLPITLTMTTNGFLVDKYLDLFIQSKLKSLNVSLDTLKREKFFAITKRDHYTKVWQNIESLIQKGIEVKLNVVLMKNVNDDEVFHFIELTRRMPIHVRFIEFMPFDKNGWDKEKVVSFQEVMVDVYQHFDVIKLLDEKHETAKKFKVHGFTGTFAFITTMSQPFCDDCNRLRLTADGKIKNCLFGKEELDLLTVYREGGNVEEVIQTSVSRKHAMMGGQFAASYQNTDSSTLQNRSMIKIGG